MKFQIALEAVKGEKQITELAEEFGVHPNQVAQWKKKLLEEGASVFSSRKEQEEKDHEHEKDNLYRKVGHQQIQIDFLKKKLGIKHLPGDEK